MGVLVNYDGKNGIVLREVEDNETVEVNPQTSERTFIVGAEKRITEAGLERRAGEVPWGTREEVV